MGALWQYRWLILVLLVAPTIAYCQYRAVERLATERCVNAGGTWDEDRDECTGLPAPKAAQSAEDEEEGEADDAVDSTTGETAAPMDDATQAGGADAAARSPYDVQYLPADGASEVRVDEPPGKPDDGSLPRQ